MLAKQLPWRAALGGIVLTFMLVVPVAALVPALFLLPLCGLWDGPFCRSSEYVEFSFLWLQFHSGVAVAFYWAYFTLIIILFNRLWRGLRHLWARVAGKKAKT